MGRIAVSGAKNAALPCVAAALLASDPVRLSHLPAVSDVRTMIRVLQGLGCTAEVEKDEEGCELSALLASEDMETRDLRAPYDLVKTMRASILVLGPLLARYGRASVSLPGGCAIGARPVNLHLEALERMGAVIEIDKGGCSRRLHT
jgi:UDP-N-acetylglucosamine 1-carboxyvinyltransferase